MLRLDDYAMYSLKRIFDMRDEVRELSKKTPNALQHEVINRIGSILMIEANLVAYIINLAAGVSHPHITAFTQDILDQAGWEPSWHLQIRKETLDTIIEQHKQAEEKGHSSTPEFTKENRILLQYGYPPALIIEQLYQAVLDDAADDSSA